MFEVVVEAGGVVQIGWSSPSQPWSDDNGVGDFALSFAFDGKREKRWSAGISQPYGQPWVAGDVIGACIDIGSSGATISFLRNGMPLGDAFSGIDPRLVFVGGISVAERERVLINAGASPLLFPVPGFFPLQRPPLDGTGSCARYLVGCIRRLLLHPELAHSGTRCPMSPDESAIVLAQLWDQVAPLLLSSPHLVVSELCPLISDLAASQGRAPLLAQLVELIEACTDEFQYASLFATVISYLSTVWRVSPFRNAVRECSPPEQPRSISDREASVIAINSSVSPVSSLRALAALFRLNLHAPLASDPRLSSWIESSLSMKDLTHVDLEMLYSHIWWECATSPEPEPSRALMIQRSDLVERAFTVVRAVQSEISLALLDTGHLIPWLARLIERNRDYTKTVLPTGLTCITSLTNIFSVLLKAFSARFGGQPLGAIPRSLLFGISGLRSDLQRISGTPGHLLKEMPPPAAAATGEEIPAAWHLLDAMAMLFFLAVSRRMKQVSQDIQLAAQGISQLDSLNVRIARATATSERVPAQVQAMKAALKEDVSALSRVCLWRNDSMFGKEPQELLAGLLRQVCFSLSAVQAKSDIEFCYVPEAYLELLVGSFHTLRRFHRTGNAFSLVEGSARAMTDEVVQFLVDRVGDPRIRSPMSKDMLNSSVIMLVQSPQLLPVFEQNGATRAALFPNVIRLGNSDKNQLVAISKMMIRIWAGKGFGVASEKPANRSSPVLQQAFREFVTRDAAAFEAFVDQLYDGLNTTLSEFGISLGDTLQHLGRAWQELEQPVQRLIAVFEISIFFARVLEILTSDVPGVFFGRELNRIRLVEFIVFTSNRFLDSAQDSSRISQMAHFAARIGGEQRLSRVLLMAPVVGICIRIVTHLGVDGAHAMLSKTPGFSPEMFAFALEVDWPKALSHLSSPVLEDFDKFVRLVEYSRSRAEEMEIQSQQQQQQATQLRDAVMAESGASQGQPPQVPMEGAEYDDTVCAICCSNPIDTEFEPCGHRSCHVCIERQLIKERVCFFCKAKVASIRRTQEK